MAPGGDEEVGHMNMNGRSNDNFSKTTIFQNKNIRSNELSVKCPFGQMAIFRTKAFK
jgi:hypothetical protein